MSLRESMTAPRTLPKWALKRKRAPKPKVDWNEFLPIAGQLADALSTSAVLSKGGRELNPLMAPIVKSTPLFYALKIGLGVGMAAVVHAQEKAGHFKRAKVLGIVAGALGFGPAVHNLRQLR